MGVNLFVPVTDDANIDMLVETVNAWGRAAPFEWAAPFEGQGGAVLTLEQALAFGPNEAPWFIMLPDPELFTEGKNEAGADLMRYSELFWCVPEGQFENGQSQACDWQAVLRESKCENVLFMKAR